MKWLLAVLLASLLAIPLLSKASELDKVFELMKTVDANEPKQKWTQIHWQPDMNTALKEAQKSGKPILVFMLVNEQGKKDATHC